MRFYHVVNGPDYPVRRIVEVFENVTGRAFQIVSAGTWRDRLETLMADEVTVEDATFLAVASALVPEDQDSQDRVKIRPGRSWSTIQLQDLLRRIAARAVNPAVYNDLLLELGQADVERTDKAVAVSFKWASQEAKRMHRTTANKEPPLKQVDSSTTSEPQTMVIHKAASNKTMAAMFLTGGLGSWILNTPGLAFLSLILYILLGD